MTPKMTPRLRHEFDKGISLPETEISDCNISLIDIRTNLGKQIVSFSGAQIWNTMPKELRNVISRKKFRQIFKKDLLEGYNIL